MFWQTRYEINTGLCFRICENVARGFHINLFTNISYSYVKGNVIRQYSKENCKKDFHEIEFDFKEMTIKLINEEI